MLEPKSSPKIGEVTLMRPFQYFTSQPTQEICKQGTPQKKHILLQCAASKTALTCHIIGATALQLTVAV